MTKTISMILKMQKSVNLFFENSWNGSLKLQLGIKMNLIAWM